MVELLKEKREGVEYYTVVTTGECGISQTGLAKLAGVSQQAISDLEKTLTSKKVPKLLEPFIGEVFTLTSKSDTPSVDGKPQGNLTIYKSLFCSAVLAHYEEHGHDEARITSKISRLAFSAIGIKAYIQEITGWKTPVILPHTDVYHERIKNVRDHHVPYDVWTVFRECSEILLLLEVDWRVPINDFDILDGSIGRRWSDFRKDKPWAGEVKSYTHQYRDKRSRQSCAAYTYMELEHFRRWLNEIYVPQHLPTYLVEKYGRHATRLIYTENEKLTDKILRITEVKRKAPTQDRLYQQFLQARDILDQRLLEGDN